MPQIYNRIPTPPTVTERHRSSSVSSASSSSSSSSLSDTPRPTDVDDSIVLSDLVRTGEASRLRRRGAMRLDHGHHNALGSTYTAPRETSPTPWDSDDEPGVVTYPHRQRRFSSSRRRRHEEEESEIEEYRYTLLCGAEIPYSGEEDPCEPWTPSIFPILPATSSSTPKIPTRRKTNGCGAIIHLRAAPRPRVHMWAARTPASSCVVPLEAHYFDNTEEAAKFERSSCGCVKEGVGCAVCGNPLGTRYIPCRMAASGMYSPGHKHYTSSLQAPWPSDAQGFPLGPEGPRYWHPTPSSSKSAFQVHSFFSSAVTSYPEYNLPPKGASEVPSTISMQEPSTIYFDRHITSSPSSFESSSSTFRDRESSFPMRSQESGVQPTTSSSSTSFYQQTTPPTFYQQQILTAWDREREETRRPTPGAAAGRRRRETWNGFENENDQEQDTDVGDRKSVV